MLSHLVPYFGDWALPEIDIEAVDEYRQFKVAEAESRAATIERGRPKRNLHGQILRPLAPSSINRTIGFLQWVLSIALEYGYVTHNAAAGKRRRLRARRPAPVHLDTAAQIEALLEAAAALDRDVRQRCGEREAIVATLVFAGPRANELCDLRWRDVDLAGGAAVHRALEDGRRPPRDQDAAAPARPPRLPQGRRPSRRPRRPRLPERNRRQPRPREPAQPHPRPDLQARRRAARSSRGLVPLPKGLTTHKLRHTFASVLIACGEDPISLMRQIGHTDPTFTLRVYTHLMSRDPDERTRLKALVRGERVIASEAPEPPLLDLKAYEQPILQALAERGGRASRSEIIAALSEMMADQHSARDLELLPSGPPRWQPRVGKVRARLVRRGWLRVGKGRGCEWELTDRGWTMTAAQEKAHRAAAASLTGSLQTA